MDKVRYRIFILAAFALVVTWAMSGATSASLVPVQFGFPVIVHTGSSVSFNSDQAHSTDSELFNMDFPAFDGTSSGGPLTGLSSMPAIGAGQSLMTLPAMSGFGNIGDMFGNSGLNLF